MLSLMPVLRKAIGFLLLVGPLSCESEAGQSTRLEPGNVSIQKRFVFLVTAAKTNNMSRFSVTVAPNANTDLPSLDAWIMLSDGDREIVRQPLVNRGTEEVCRYEFEAKTNLLLHSQFV